MPAALLIFYGITGFFNMDQAALLDAGWLFEPESFLPLPEVTTWKSQVTTYNLPLLPLTTYK